MKIILILCLFFFTSLSGVAGQTNIKATQTACQEMKVFKKNLSKLAVWKNCKASSDNAKDTIEIEKVESLGFIKMTFPPAEEKKSMVNICSQVPGGNSFICHFFNPFDSNSGWKTNCENEKISFSKEGSEISFLKSGQEIVLASSSRSHLAQEDKWVENYKIECSGLELFDRSKEYTPAQIP